MILKIVRLNIKQNGIKYQNCKVKLSLISIFFLPKKIINKEVEVGLDYAGFPHSSK